MTHRAAGPGRHRRDPEVLGRHHGAAYVRVFDDEGRVIERAEPDVTPTPPVEVEEPVDLGTTPAPAFVEQTPEIAVRPGEQRPSSLQVAPSRADLADAHGVRSQWQRAWASRASGEALLSTGLRTRLRDGYGDLTALRRVGKRPPLREYLTELWQRRYFIYAGARGEALTRYSNERLGKVWFVLRPLLDAAFYWVIFGVVLDVSRGMTNFIAFILIGVFMFQLTSRSISGGVSLVRNSKAMIRAFAFPKVGLALSLVTRDLLTSMPAIGVMFVMVMAIPPHELPTPAWVLFPAILAVHVALNLGLTLLFGWLGARLPDLAQAMGFATRLLMYASAVIFPIERFLDHPAILAVIQANPIYQVLDAYRTVLIDGVAPDPTAWAWMGGWAGALLLVGFVCFWADEERYTRV